MFTRSLHLCFLIVIIALGFTFVSGQSVEDPPPYGHRLERDPPRGVKEMLYRVRIDRAKKDYDEMLERSEETIRLSVQVEKSFAERGQLTEADIEKLESVAKNVKKIRNELGGDDDEEALNELLGGERPMTPETAVNTLKTTVIALADEVKRSSRFSISVTAIRASNAALTLARFLLRR